MGRDETTASLQLIAFTVALFTVTLFTVALFTVTLFTVALFTVTFKCKSMNKHYDPLN
jgi:hypothetical protein